MKIIYIIGNVATGKTTALPFIAKSLRADILHADELFQTSNPFRDSFLTNRREWALYNELWMAFERARMLKEKLKKSRKKILIVDSGLLMSWAYMYSHYFAKKVDKKQWQTFEKIFTILTKDLHKDFVVTIVFNASSKTMFHRMKKRGREYEVGKYARRNNPFTKYIEELGKSIEVLKKELVKKKKKVVEISEEEAFNFFEDKNKKQKLIAKIIKEVI